jgi:cell division protease FtsH
MSPEVGPVAIGEKRGEVFIGRDLAHMANVAAATLELVDSEVRRLVRDADATARRVIQANADILQQLANALLQAETLSGPALDVILAGVAEWPEPLVVEKNKSLAITLQSVEVGEDTRELWP